MPGGYGKIDGNKDGKENRFKEGDQAHLTYTMEVAEKLFIELLEFVQDDKNDILCQQEAYIKFPKTTHKNYYYLLDKYPKLHKFKAAICDAITARVNRGALREKMSATAAIWRMKQNGEKEVQEIKQFHNFEIEPIEWIKEDKEEDNAEY